MGAAKPLGLVEKGLAIRWKLLELMSLLTAVEPVAIAMWEGAVSEGVTVSLSVAVTPVLLSNPSPVLLSSTPLCRYRSTMVSIAPSSEIKIILGAIAFIYILILLDLPF
jgi:hypothetical protein